MVKLQWQALYKRWNSKKEETDTELSNLEENKNSNEKNIETPLPEKEEESEDI